MKKYIKLIIILVLGIVIIGIILYKKNDILPNEIFIDETFTNGQKEIKDFQVGKSYSVILYEDGSVWIAGSNYYYTSRNGYRYGIQKDNFTKLNIEKINQIAVGNNFVIALNENGEIYSWGGNEFGQLGRNSYGVDDTPMKLNISNIQSIYVNGSQVAALSYDNIAYYWGYATESKYSDGNEILKIENYKINDIFLTGQKYFFKTEDEKILVLGFGCDGITDERNGWATKPVEFDIDNVLSIKGESYPDETKTYIIKKDGAVYILDTNSSKELKELESDIKIKDILFFSPHSGISYNDDSNNDYYLIVDNNNNLYFQNQLILTNVKNIMKAKDSIADKILILKNDGTVYNLGYLIDNLAKTEGYSDYFRTIPIKVNIQNIKLMGITEKYIVLIDNDNYIHRLGKSEHGGLGIEENEIVNEFHTEERRIKS